MMRCSGILKSIVMFYCLAASDADWVKVPILNPEKYDTRNFTELSEVLHTVNPFNQNSSPSNFMNILNATHSDFQLHTKNNDLDKREDIQELQKNLLLSSDSSNIDIIQFVMNNSHKIDRSGMENSNSKNMFPSGIIQNIYSTLLHQTPFINEGKMAFLEKMKRKVHGYIRSRIEQIWDNKERQARTEKGMGFPSMDGALMTISFLLFAVFLIKLVKQLIQQVQDKANAQALLMTGVTPVVPAPAGGRRRRGIPPDVFATAQIFHFIEGFKAQKLT